MTPAAAIGRYRRALAGACLQPRRGTVRRIDGLAIEVEGLRPAVGDLCTLQRPGAPLLAEVVGLHGDRAALMPYAGVEGLAIGCEAVPLGTAPLLPVGPALLGRVIDGFGRPLDGRPVPACSEHRLLRAIPRQPLAQPRISEPLATGIRCIDTLLTLGRGQRVGIFAGSGVGKSTLLGMMARHVQADVSVVALIGERVREVREFVEDRLGADGLARSVVIVAAADQPAPARLRAAHAACTVAEAFRDRGRHVLLMLDSVTRFAMARREVGLAAGEPPTARGYTPSVFSELPRLCERGGPGAAGGSITSLLTVLVEGDDLADPVADHMRATLDGHIVLSRRLAQAGHHPAIDLLQSASRVMPQVASTAQRTLARTVIAELALLERNRALLEIGAWQRGGHPALDLALDRQPALDAWLRQAEGGADPVQARAALAALYPPVPPGSSHGQF